MHYISGELAGSTAMSFVPSFSVHSNYECIMLSVNYLEDIWCDYLQRTVCECDGPGKIRHNRKIVNGESLMLRIKPK